MIIIPGFDVFVVDACFFQNFGIVEHDTGTDVVVNSVEFSVFRVVVEAAHDKVIFHRLNNVIEIRQLDIAFQIVGKHVDLDIHNVRSTLARLQGNGKLVVHILIGINLHVDIKLRIVGVGIPLVQHDLV